MKNKCIVIIAVLLCSLSLLSAQPLQLNNKIDSIGSALFPASGPGGAICVIRDGNILYRKTFGMANLTYRIPVSDSTVFNLASISKQFTAFLVLMLEEKGKLRLDDSLGKYLPEFIAYKDITLRQLLHHTSGIPSTDNLRLFAGLSLENPWDSEDETTMHINYKKLNFKPGDEQVYSNANYFLLARVIEKVTGKSFGEYIRQELFLPLGMKTAVIYDTRGMIIPNLASGYRKNGDNYIEAITTAESIFGSTNVHVTLNDLILWTSNFTRPSIGSDNLFRRLFVATDTLNNGDTISYTGGLTVWKHRGLRIADHGGFTEGFKTQTFYVPDEAFSVGVLSNYEGTDAWKICMSVTELCLSDKLLPEKKIEHKEINIDKSLYHSYSGTYVMTDGQLLKFGISGDTLLLLIPGAPKFALYPEKENEFFLKDFDAQCTFVKGADGKVNEIIWHQNSQNVHGQRFSEPKPLSAEDMKAFTGEYENRALNVTYPVAMKNNELVMTFPRIFRMVNINPEVRLNHTSGNKFYSSLGMIEFRQDKNGSISSFVIVDVGRLKNIEFIRRDQ
jgi:CubicO group peptidase (beta-lactamase class C family)